MSDVFQYKTNNELNAADENKMTFIESLTLLFQRTH